MNVISAPPLSGYEHLPPGPPLEPLPSPPSWPPPPMVPPGGPPPPGVPGRNRPGSAKHRVGFAVLAAIAMAAAFVGAGRLQLHGTRPTLAAAPLAQAPVVPPSG
ncbi:MAG: hypothetical protein QOD57_315, partial [Actinomycetota bacterium]|nr:hypothetical protein [Actinomycetota bacterium]